MFAYLLGREDRKENLLGQDCNVRTMYSSTEDKTEKMKVGSQGGSLVISSMK